MDVWSNQVFRQILLGSADPQSPLVRLRGNRDCLQLIFGELSKQWRSHVQKTTGYISVFHSLRSFPKPIQSSSGENVEIDVNMMPIIMGDCESLPPELQRYARLIQRCLHYACPAERGKIGYLTVQESYVEKGSSQRRPGLHIESPGRIRLRSSQCAGKVYNWGEGTIAKCSTDHGETVDPRHLDGGIFMASNIDDTCVVWNLLIDRHVEMIGDLGDLEFARDILRGEEFSSRRKMIKANEVVWITDRTPHESLPLVSGKFRQFFRLVTSNLTGWYEDHSTKNPLGILPGPSVLMISGNKFPRLCSLIDSSNQTSATKEEALFLWMGSKVEQTSTQT